MQILAVDLTGLEYLEILRHESGIVVAAPRCRRQHQRLGLSGRFLATKPRFQPYGYSTVGGQLFYASSFY